MKRFIFWFVAALIGISLLRHSREEVPRHMQAHHRAIAVQRVTPRETLESVQYVEGDRSRLESAEGLSVPIVPGTRVTKANFDPPKPPKAPAKPKDKAKRPEPPKPPQVPASVETLTVTGRRSSTEERAKQDAESQFRKTMVNKLGPEIGTKWEIPQGLLRSMIVDSTVKPHELISEGHDYGTVYEATITVDVSKPRRDAIVAAYHHEMVMKRLAMMGGGLAFVLTCLGGVSSYIRTDEKTKGYYTNALRLALAGGLGATGVAIYRLLA